MFPTLETERLRLHPLQENDLNNMYALQFNPVVAATMEHFDEIITPVEYQLGFAQMLKAGSFMTLWHKEDNCFLGFAMIHQYIKPNKINNSQMGIAIMPEYWGHRFCTEATKKLLHFAFIGIKTPWICANQFQDNSAAGSVLKRCGFNYYTTYTMKNRLYDQYRYTSKDYYKHNKLFPDEINPLNPYNYAFPIKKSPFSYDNPIRKINYINYIKQPTEYLCGQSVVAMLADVSVDKIIDVMQTDKGTSTSTIRDALQWYGLKTTTNARLKYTKDTVLPKCCILSVKLPRYGHWALYYKGTYYDPEFGVLDKLPEKANLCYYWEVITQ